jgi:hypothetical protein
VLNAGTIAHLNGVVNAIHSVDRPLADAVIKVAEAVAADTALRADQKRDAVDLLDAIAEEAKRPRAERRKAVVLPLVTGLSDLITIGTGAAAAWHAYGPLILAAFGIG